LLHPLGFEQEGRKDREEQTPLLLVLPELPVQKITAMIDHFSQEIAEEAEGGLLFVSAHSAISCAKLDRGLRQTCWFPVGDSRRINTDECCLLSVSIRAIRG
jgi:hypothetical protein